MQERRPSAIALRGQLLPRGVLFGLDAVDGLDRTAFAVLLPDIRDHFGLSNATALGLVAATIATALIEAPLAFSADRSDRIRITATGAAGWALFSAGMVAAEPAGNPDASPRRPYLAVLLHYCRDEFSADPSKFTGRHDEPADAASHGELGPSALVHTAPTADDCGDACTRTVR